MTWQTGCVEQLGAMGLLFVSRADVEDAVVRRCCCVEVLLHLHITVNAAGFIRHTWVGTRCDYKLAPYAVKAGV